MVWAPHIEEVTRRKLVTLLVVTKIRSDQSVDQPLNRRSEGTLLGYSRNIGPPSITPELHEVLLLWWLSNTIVKIIIKIRNRSILFYLNR